MTAKNRDRAPGSAGDDHAGSPWPPPTRRAFVGMIGAAAAALAVHRATTPSAPAQVDEDRPRSTTRWIGHC